MTTTGSGHPAAPSSTNRQSLGIGAWIITLALLPLIGAGFFIAGQIRDLNDSHRQADAVAAATRDLVALSELRVQLLDELIWAGATLGLGDLGIPPALTEPVLGVDFDLRLSESRDVVDDLFDDVDWPALKASLGEVRQGGQTDLETLERHYSAVIDLVSERADESYDRAVTIAGDMQAGSELLSALRVLQASSDARGAVTQQMSSYFVAQFRGGSTASTGFRTLISAMAEHDQALAEIQRTSAASGRIRPTLDAIERSEAVIEFHRAVETLSNQPPLQGAASSLDLAVILEDLPQTTASFQAGAGAVEQYVLLVDAANRDVESLIASVNESAASTSRRTFVNIAALIVASALYATILTRSIARPLRQLATGARDLRLGRKPQLTATGPREIRRAMNAINEASAHISLAERQASALARGELNNPALSEAAPGTLGQSLHQAVQTLTQSMGMSAEFSERLQHEASHDSLTGLANRRASIERIRQAMGHGDLVVLFIDLDGFKTVNDTHGHTAGDEVLRIVAERLRSRVRPSDFVGRLGGDEFVVVCGAFNAPTVAHSLADRLLDGIQQPINLGSSTVSIGACIGMATASTRAETSSPEALLHDADLAMFRAKSLGRNRVEICDADLCLEVDRRSDIEQALRKAIEHDELLLHFQPILDATTGRVASVEGLVRWERPGVGLLPPSEFIPIAERSDLITELDAWVIAEAIGHLATWQDDEVLAQLPVAINISARHVLDSSLVTAVSDQLAARNVDPSMIIFEVTESSLILDLELAAQNLAGLRELGVRVAIDDFGSGYTSLARLRAWPFDCLKIDRAFIADESEREMVKLMVEMGHLLGVTVVAEGIETHEQAGALRTLGVDEMQGFLYGRPVPVDEMKTLVAASFGRSQANAASQ